MVSKIKLPKLQTKEESAVTSSVIDVFYRPEKKPVSPVLADIARSLSGVVPQLYAYEEVQEDIEKTEQESKADVDFRNENIKDFKKLVKAGKIPEGANPYYIKKYVENSLREKARIFNEELYIAYTDKGVDTQLGASAFNDFYREFAQEFSQKNNLEMYDSVSMAEGFIPYAEAYRSELQHNHILGRIKKIEDGQKETLRINVENSIIDNQDINEDALDRALINYSRADELSYEDKQTLYIAQTIQTQLDELIAVGMNAQTANDLVVKEVIEVAKAMGDDSILTVLENIITDKKTGARLAGSYKGDIMDAVNDILQINETKENSRWTAYVRGKALRKENVLNYFVYNDEAMLDIETWINKYNLQIEEDNEENNTNEPKLSYDEINALRTLSASYITGLQKENIIPSIEGDEFIKQLNVDLATNPQDPTILDRIQEGLNSRYYGTNDFKAYLTTYFSRSKLETSQYFTDLRFNTELSNYERSVGQLAGDLGLFAEESAELIASGKNQMLNFAYGLLSSLQKPTYLEKHKLDPEDIDELKNHFFQRLSEERKRIIDIIIPDMKDSYRKEMEVEEEAIKSGNPYK